MLPDSTRPDSLSARKQAAGCATQPVHREIDLQQGKRHHDLFEGTRRGAPTQNQPRERQAAAAAVGFMNASAGRV